MGTLSYYSENAENFILSTQDVDFEATQRHFLQYLKPKAHILDFGCGSGRDSKFFLEQGYEVSAIDGCPEFVRYATEYTGIKVRQLLFDELDEVEVYDGIWACASILHLAKKQIEDVYKKIAAALKKGGYCYSSFKYGDFSGERNGRFFTDFTELSFAEIIGRIDNLVLVESWITGDVRDGRGSERWLNVIVKKI